MKGLDAKCCDTIHVHMCECLFLLMGARFCSVRNPVPQKSVYSHLSLCMNSGHPLVTVSKSADLSPLYSTEWEEALKLIQAGSPRALPTCRMSFVLR